jgi:hypothetical protein
MAAMDRAPHHNKNNVDRFRRLGIRPVDFVRAIEMAARALARRKRPPHRRGPGTER